MIVQAIIIGAILWFHVQACLVLLALALFADACLGEEAGHPSSALAGKSTGKSVTSSDQLHAAE